MKDHLDAERHARGQTRYVDDDPPPSNMLHGAVVPSPVAHGRLNGIDISRAQGCPGVVAVLVAEDIPGENQIGPVIQDEPLLAVEELHFQGQPVALVLASTPEQAREARAFVEFDIEELEPVVDPKEAFERGSIIAEPQRLSRGDVDQAWQLCDEVLEGSCEIGGQEHVYLETQRARAYAEEGGVLRVCSSTQSPYAAQKAIAAVLGRPFHEIEVDVRRLGGGFGGKEDQATAWACLAALGTQHTGRAVQLVLRRDEDVLWTGKRHPYRCDYRIGIKQDGRILAFDVRHFQNSGAATDLSLAVLGRTVFHSTASYGIPNVRIFAVCCRTNLPPMTAFRGFGGPQGMFVMESALTRAARAVGLSREQVQEKNLLSDGDRFPYGQVAESCHARRCWQEAVDRYDVARRREEIDQWNCRQPRHKKGMALMPVCFGISFTATFMNQASSLVHVYTDGSVSVSTGGVEMGQGLNTNIATVVSRALGISRDRVRVESTNTRRIANMSASAASATTLLNGNAALRAAGSIRERLLNHEAGRLGVEVSRLAIAEEVVLLDGEATPRHWPDLVKDAYLARVNLSAHGFYATPKLWFDAEKGEGHPFAYHVYGTAVIEVSVDTLLGTYDIEAVRIVHDLGRSLNPLVDLGQVEGGLAQGLGWMTLEDLRFNARGRILSGALATYKVPDVFFMPRELEVEFLEGVPTEHGPFGSKAVGEPPLMYGIGAHFAIRDALLAARPDSRWRYEAPLTPERVLTFLTGDPNNEEPARPQPSVASTAEVTARV